MRSIWLLAALAFVAGAAPDKPFLQSELVFPLEHWHNHASMIVELPNGDLLVDWFHGSGERTADDVVIRGARLKKNSSTWSEPFLLADTPGYPDTNATMFIDPQQRLWLLWPTILANEWHTALMKYRISSDYQRDGPPRWAVSEVLHVTPGDEFKTVTDRELDRLTRGAELDDRRREYVEKLRRDAGDKLTRRIGWMTRAHPYVLDGTRLIVPLYSDGFSFSLMAITDDWGATWKTSTPLVGFGNIQPSLVRKKDGTLVAYMRDNGPAPKRLHISRSRDRGETWSTVEDTTLPNPGSGAEVIALANGHWVLASNDLEQGRWSLAVSLSEDEGATWPWTRHLERDPPSDDPQQRGEYHYPSIVQAKDGTLHASYSHFIPPAAAKKDAEGRSIRKAIKHAHFNEAWIRSQPESAVQKVDRAIQVGYCTSLANLAAAKAAGFDYVELSTTEIAALSDDDFEQAVRRVVEVGLPTPAANLFLPATLKVTGPDVNREQQMAYVRKAFDRLSRLGVQTVVFGSGGARRVPDGFPAREAFDQLVDFGRRIAPEARARGITVAVEPLRRAETNIINSAAEGLELVEAVGDPAFQLMIDFFHLASEGEDPAIVERAREHVRHLHMANPNGRVFPLAWDEYEYSVFFAKLRSVGYRGRISVEASSKDFAAEAPRAIALLRRAFER